MKFKYVMIRTTNPDLAIDFHTKILGLALIADDYNAENKYRLLFFGISKDPIIEITYNLGVSEYILGNQYGYVTLEVSNEEFHRIQKRYDSHKGAKFRSFTPSRVVYLDHPRKALFIKDFDGVEYEIYCKEEY